jgi:putative colanic acid biosynthesis acetyltransferase WcaF
MSGSRDSSPAEPGPAPQRHLRDFTGQGYDKGRPVLHQACWFATQKLVFRAWWFPARFRPALLRLFGAQVGQRVLIRHGVKVHWPWKLTIGDDCWIGEDSWFHNLEPITVGSDVCISQRAFLCAGSHDYRSPTLEFDNGPITIGDGAWVAVDALVLRGVNVGRGATVGARAVVSRDVPDGALVRAPQSLLSDGATSAAVAPVAKLA